jgi:O-antigen/teichoic acid export membrane protein
MVQLLTVLIFPLLVLLAVEAPVFVPWLFGHRWAPAVEPTQILAIGGAATLATDAVGSALMAAGRPRALLGFGWSHFACYAGAVLVVAPHGIVAVAVAAAVVHTAFLVVAYVMLMRGRKARALAELWGDLRPALVSCVAIAVVAIPLSAALRGASAPAVPYLALVTLAGGAAYLVALRFAFPESLRTLRNFVARLLPRKSLRVFRHRLTPAESR